MTTKRVTSIDVARHAGVSQSTVSRTFTPGAGVSEAARRKVVEAASELGYTPNAIARSLSKQHTDIVGIVMGRITSPFHPYVLEKFINELQNVGKQALLFSTPPDSEIDELLELVLQYQVDALIVASATISSDMAEACARNGTPVVLFNRYVLGANVNAVCTDNVEAGRLVANELIDAGHQKLALIEGKANTSTAVDRKKGYFDRLQERGHVDVVADGGDHTYEAGFEAALRLLDRDDPPDAIFCSSDNAALGAMDAARYQLGIKIPAELSVVGFDDIPAAAWPSYSLTTIRTPVNRMVEATLDLLLDRLEKPSMSPEFLLLPGELIRRHSARLAGVQEINTSPSPLLTKPQHGA
ncbi:MAG: LacI family DNA-binding transcriptional regulator [Chloroflexi bacterium]|nr:LacI family DNA-binding transcriptional regulator [Chloroflexota bacterium]